VIVKQYVDARYVTANEAVWHLFAFNMSQKHPSIERLPVHLEDMQQILLNLARIDDAVRNIKCTALQCFFDLVDNLSDRFLDLGPS
jgi:hypothetical protein